MAVARTGYESRGAVRIWYLFTLQSIMRYPGARDMPSIRSAAFIAAALLLALAGCDGDTPAPATSASAAAAPYTPVVGTCFEYETQRTAQDTVPCDGVHRFEVAYVGEVADPGDTPPLPDSDAVRAAYKKCSVPVDKYVGGASRALMVNIEVGLPSLAAWQAGARWFSCDLAKAIMQRTADESDEESVSGSVRGAYTNPSSSIRMPCFTVTTKAGGILADWKPVPCTKKHTIEMVGLVKSASTAASRPKVEDKVYDRCFDLIAAYTKVPQKDDQRYGIRSVALYPPYVQWVMGERAVRCGIYLSKGGLSRSLAGAGPAAF
jgi:hypothetical protein